MNQRTVLGATATALLLSGCGAETDYKNNPRPPSPITITAAISNKRVEVSPQRFGAGPVTLVVSNQTGRLRDLILESASSPGTGRTGLAPQHTGPINPQGTASLKADLREGRYTVRVRDIRPTTIVVGHPRASAQNDLLQP
ncbi:MAG TPA: hypothetical protein VGJ32_16065 [Solirubrobacteraceae bacterium]